MDKPPALRNRTAPGLRDLAAPLAAVLLIKVLAGCGGGGGGGGSGAAATLTQTAPSTPAYAPAAEPAAGSDATAWKTTEYENSTGLDQIRAAEGYARRTMGEPGGGGVRIAIVDGGIDLDHPDLARAVSGQATYVVPGESATASDHATHIAGIAAATRSQTGQPGDMHGVAYNAKLVNIQVSRPSTGSSFFSTIDVAYGIGSAAGLQKQYGGATITTSDGQEQPRLSDPAAEAEIINLSLGGNSPSDVELEALQDAAAQGKIVAIAAGNYGALEPAYPARYAGDPSLNGLVIAVGNLEPDGTDHPSSNLCGSTANFCLFAPGTAINSTVSGAGYDTKTGTSMAAPYVAGAAAVVMAAFPGVSAQEVVNRLLTTATDLGAPGVDAWYGRGLLNLEAAMAPVGPLSLPAGATVEGEKHALADTSLALPAALGPSLAGSALLRSVLALDTQNFPFAVDLTGHVTVRRRADDLAGLVTGRRGRSATLHVPGIGTAAFVPDPESLDDRARRQAYGGYPFGPVRSPTAEPEGQVPVHLAAPLTGQVEAALAFNAVPAGFDPLEPPGAALAGTPSLVAPFAALAGTGDGGALSYGAGHGARLSVVLFQGDAAGAATELHQVALVQRFNGGAAVSLGLGHLQEDGALLGGAGTGAFAGLGTTASDFAILAAELPVTGPLSLFGRYTEGRTAMHGSGLLHDLDRVRVSAYALGLRLTRDRDRLSVVVGQPLRAHAATATLVVPVARTADGQVLTRPERIALVPEGRETMVQLGYDRRLAAGTRIVLQVFVRHQPDHDPHADPALGGGLRLDRRF